MPKNTRANSAAASFTSLHQPQGSPSRPLTTHIAAMSCPRCKLRLQRASRQPSIRVSSRRAFHTSPRHNRLGAFTYAQEWQTGTYHFNKAHTKTLPVATQHTDTLLSQYLTQQKKRSTLPTEDAAYRLQLRTSIAAQRRKADRVFISKATAKDFGDRVVVSAFVYDGEAAAAKEAERRRAERKGVKGEGGQGAGRRRGPVRRGRVGGSGGAVRTPGARRMGGSASLAGAGGGVGFRRVAGIGSGAGVGVRSSSARGPPARGPPPSRRMG